MRASRITIVMGACIAACFAGAFAAEPAAEKATPKAAQAAPAPSKEGKTPSALKEKAPDTFRVKFDTSKGEFVVAVTRASSPNGADRFYNLVKSGFYDNVRFFRVVPNFVVQFGISGDPEVSKSWMDANIQDDPVKESNTKGTISYAMKGPNTRTTQVFINLSDNTRLDAMGFAPFAKVESGMDVVEKLNGEYADTLTSSQGQIYAQGNAFLAQRAPNLDYVKTAKIVK